MIILEIAAAAILPMVVVVAFAEFIGWLHELGDKIKLKHAQKEKK